MKHAALGARFLPPHTQAFAALWSNGTLQLFGAMELAAFEARFF
jgi:hypothetical protein